MQYCGTPVWLPVARGKDSAKLHFCLMEERVLGEPWETRPRSKSRRLTWPPRLAATPNLGSPARTRPLGTTALQ